MKRRREENEPGTDKVVATFDGSKNYLALHYIDR